MLNRVTAFERLKENPQIPVLIIGGGVNGIGTFRDLALQGIDVVLVERNDFCSGASAASSHMVHGGIRYLENGEFRLVKEAVRERNRLLKNAPHLVEPLATTIPIFRWESGILNAPLKFLNLLDKPSERGAWVIKAGLTMYDAFTSGESTVPKHDFNLRKSSLEKFPMMSDDVVCTATYYDAAMPSPERICMELLRDGREAHSSAVALNYTSAVALIDGQITLRDELTGDEISVTPQVVVNAAGPWIDFANHELSLPTKLMGGTKGSHIVLDHPHLYEAIQGNEIFFENEDGRIVLIYPLKDKVLVGTSDLPIDNPSDARCTQAEIDYFLELIGRVFPSVTVAPEQIVFRYSGVRPLPASDAKVTAQISRDHSIKTIQPSGSRPFPILNLIGGKWTTFRAFSEQVSSAVLRRLDEKRHVYTTHRPLPGARNFPENQAEWITQWHEKSGVDTEWLSRWLGRYGTLCESLFSHSKKRLLTTPLQSLPTYSIGELMWLIEEEQVEHLVDLLLRRSLIGMLGLANRAVIEETAIILGEAKGWEFGRVAAEVEGTIAYVTEFHQMNY